MRTHAVPMQTYCPNCFDKIDADAMKCPACGCAVLIWGRSMSETERLIHSLGHPERSERLKAIYALADLPQSEAALPLADLCFGKPGDVWMAVEVIRTLAAMPAVERVEVALARLALEHPAGPVQTLATHALDTKFGGAGT